MSKKSFRILGEEVVRRAERGDDEQDNPYWAWDEDEVHPDPSRGCIRRGVCCRSSPGWFAPGEVEAAAAARGLSPDDFVRRFLIIDAIEVDGEQIHVFAPIKLGRDGEPALPPASRADALYRALRGVCVFYTGEGCGIYATRPFECRGYDCTNAPEDNPSHEAIARLWRDAQRAAAATP